MVQNIPITPQAVVTPVPVAQPTPKKTTSGNLEHKEKQDNTAKDKVVCKQAEITTETPKEEVTLNDAPQPTITRSGRVSKGSAWLQDYTRVVNYRQNNPVK